jgi:hypothetical protein
MVREDVRVRVGGLASTLHLAAVVTSMVAKKGGFLRSSHREHLPHDMSEEQLILSALSPITCRPWVRVEHQAGQ